MGNRGAGARKRRNARRAEARNLALAASGAELTLLAEEARNYSASGSSGLPLGPRTASWDAAAADKAVRTWADAADAPNAKYAQAFLWKAPDAQAFGDYKLGFAEPIDGALTANWAGLTAAAGALQGARGGVKIPSADVAAVKSRIAGYYTKAAKQYKDKGIKPPWTASDEASVIFGITNGLDVFYASDGEPTNENGRYIGIGGDFNPVELVAAQHAAAAHALAYAQLGEEAGPAMLSVTALTWREALAAAMPACADCGHAYASHLGQAGPCTMADCPCTSYSTVDEDATILADGEVEGLRFRLEVAPEASSALAAALAPHLKLVALGTDSPDTVGIDEASDAVISRLETEFETFLLEFVDTTVTTLPDAHKPGERVPKRRPTPGVPDAPAPAAAATGPIEWSAIFAPEGKLTSDGRAFAPGSITWRELPLTLMAMIETSEGGHVGAQVCGRIEKIWRDDTAGLIRASGVFDNGEYGQKISGLVNDQTLRGVSVDLAIHRYESGPRSDWFDDEGNWAPKEQAATDGPSLVDILYGTDEPIVSVVYEAEIGMTTVCPFPAFAEAKIAVGESLVAAGIPSLWTITQGGLLTTVERVSAPLTASAALTDAPAPADAPDGVTPLTASAAGDAPELPPAAWFTHPPQDGPGGSITVDDDGRVSGYAALWDSCHIGYPGRCVSPPESASNYAYFHLGEVVCDDGSRVSCGQITLDTGHAGLDLGRAAAARHYDDTGTAIADVVCGEDEYGIWVAGALRADAPAEKVRVLRGAKLSGDWRSVNGERELVALLCVNVPGFPVPRVRALTADGEVQALTAAGIPLLEEELTPAQLEQLQALRAHEEFTQLAAEAA